ncbi:hypothetical protein FQN57_000097 [Myotisia sp. PD_48]|nr:hypothetical protein FQN57_000097 [Myotisia sp. PD_48]
MDVEFPPLPQPSTSREAASKAENCDAILLDGPSTDDGIFVSIRPDGDVILDCIYPHDTTEPSLYRVKLCSVVTSRSSSYFKTLLDPKKFLEGRSVFNFNNSLGSEDESRAAALGKVTVDQLPHIKIELPPLSNKADLRDILTVYFDFLDLVGRKHPPETGKTQKSLSDATVPLLASLIVLSDRFSSQDALEHALWMNQNKNKTIHRLLNLSTNNEERIREGIYVAWFLKDVQSIRRLSHNLVVNGSVNWTSDKSVSVPGLDRPLWWHLPGGVEEELQLRHQCVLDKINELQTYFLRCYGAVHSPQPSSPNILYPAGRQLQCRRAYENSRACDSFHLGEMIRFLTTRSKTLSLESTIPGSEPGINRSMEGDNYGINADDHYATEHSGAAHPTNLNTIISSLKQCPEYQIDSNHLGCGIRRRLVPILDCIESYTSLGPKALTLGICLEHSKGGLLDSWRSCEFQDRVSVVMSGGKIQSVDISLKPNNKCQGHVSHRPFIMQERCELLRYCDCFSNSLVARAVFSGRIMAWE